MRYKIVFVHGIAEIGGAERELLTIATALATEGYEPIVVCPPAGPLRRELATRGIKTRDASFPPWRKVKGFHLRREAVRSLRAVLSSEEPALLHVNDMWWVPQTRQACRGFSCPIVTHVRQEIEPPKVKRYELDRVDLVIAVSQHVQRAVEDGGVHGDRIRTIYSGVDLDKIATNRNGAEIRRRIGLGEHDFVLGTVANLFARKGYEVMLHALPAILEEAPSAQYLIIGTGDHAYERKLRELAQRLGVGGHVHFLGFQHEVAPFLAALDVYVHPALMEGFGIALLEAMAAGKAVVASRVAGPLEIVQEGRTGCLPPSGDSAAFARHVLALFRDPAGRRQMGQEGRQTVQERFTTRDMLRELTTAYRERLGFATSTASPTA